MQEIKKSKPENFKYKESKPINRKISILAYLNSIEPEKILFLTKIKRRNILKKKKQKSPTPVLKNKNIERSEKK